MKRLILCAMALILTAGALTPHTVKACTLANRCDPKVCLRNCLIVGSEGGTCVDVCTCRCT
jgi:hypothetical protein